MMRIRNLFSLSLCFWSIVICADQNSDYENYSISSETSWIKVLIYPDGPLKHLGHHHVISHQNIKGNVQFASDPIDSIISIEFAVDEFTVDDYELRKQEGGDFDGEVPQKDIDGTKKNMLSEKLLNSIEFPSIKIKSKSIEGQHPDYEVRSDVNIKDRNFNLVFPARVNYDKKSFVSSGEINLSHDMLGLTPFSAAGGLLKVRDLMVVRYKINGLIQQN